jgi:hypothetical protein
MTSIFFSYCLKWCSATCSIFFIDNNFFGMIYEHLCDYFHLKDATNDFLELFELCFHIAWSHFLSSNYTCLGSIVYFGNAQFTFW